MPKNVIRIAAAGGHGGNAYLAVAAAGSGPGIALFHEDGGEARPVADLYAAEGYAVLAPEAFGTTEEAVAAIIALRGRSECTGTVAVLGFGDGSLPALRTAAEQRVAAAVCHWAGDSDELCALAPRLDCPIALHLAEDDPAASTAELARVSDAFAGRPQTVVYVYPGTRRGFEHKPSAHYDRAAAGLAHSRSIALLRQAMGPHYDLEALWEAHTRYEFETRDAAATMATMVPEPYVNHVPVMTGGVGQRDLARFYADHFIPKCPADIAMVPVSRTIGADRVVDEMVVSFTHDIEIDWMLPGVAPTGRRVEVPLVAIVGFRGDKLCHEHIYWDQASVLVQIGLLDPKTLPVAGVEAARKLLDETLPSNTLMPQWREGAAEGE
jgi:carboxymethylenebutenolidase